MEATGRYVHRDDQNAMKTFVKEVGCLCACKMIISFGGFLNDSSVQAKIIQEPYSEAAFLNVKRVRDQDCDLVSRVQRMRAARRDVSTSSAWRVSGVMLRAASRRMWLVNSALDSCWLIHAR